MTVAGILRTIPLVSSASSTGERLETRNAVIIVLALLELVHLQIKTDCTRKDSRKSQIDKYMEVILWRMDLLRSRATSKAKMVICLNNTTNGVLCVLNSSKNRLLITFAGLPASIP